VSAMAPPLLWEIARSRGDARAAAWQEAAARWEERIPAALAGWHVDLDPTGREFVLYRRAPDLATLAQANFYDALDDAWRIAAYYELLPLAELERLYAGRLAFRPPWHRRAGRLARG